MGTMKTKKICNIQTQGDEFFVVKKLGLEMATMAGADEEADKEN